MTSFTIHPAPHYDTAADVAQVSARLAGFRWSPVDVYRDIHKGLRAELFALVGRSGSLDLVGAAERHDLGRHVHSTIALLESHAHHEDDAIHPVLIEAHPGLVERLDGDHARFDRHLAAVAEIADDILSAPVGRPTRQAFYLELSAFTAAYLEHIDFEERTVMPALEDTIGPAGVEAVLGQIIGSIPPDMMTASLTVMLPTLDLDDRTDLLGGMQAAAPPEVFDHFVSLARSVLHRADFERLADRLQLDGALR